jgi:succinate dehydrogenase/fumarate reductase flavoprotein subunit
VEFKVSSKRWWIEEVLTWSGLYTVKDLAEHYVRCGHRMSGEESERVLDMVSGKYSRNPQVSVKEAEKRLAFLKRRRDWENGGLYPESRQPLMEKYVAVWRPEESASKKNESLYSE